MIGQDRICTNSLFYEINTTRRVKIKVEQAATDTLRWGGGAKFCVNYKYNKNTFLFCRISLLDGTTITSTLNDGRESTTGCI